MQKLLTIMDSRLEVASVYGKGSEFSFKLRRKVIDATPIGTFDERNLKPVDRGANKFLIAPNAKILAVDDNDMKLKVIGGLCMSGIETLHVLRGEKILSDKTKVILLTASAIASMREVYLREGFEDYLNKPIEVAELETILERHLPAEFVTFESNDKPAQIEPPEEIPAENEPVSEDEFSRSERKIFAKTCPDINLDTALQYSRDSKSFLVQMMTFTEAGRVEKIQAAFYAQDVKNYQILVHALKSTLLSIGAENLSALAKDLELAAKNNDLDKILSGHAELMTAYQKVRNQISKWLEVTS